MIFTQPALADIKFPKRLHAVPCRIPSGMINTDISLIIPAITTTTTTFYQKSEAGLSVFICHFIFIGENRIPREHLCQRSFMYFHLKVWTYNLTLDIRLDVQRFKSFENHPFEMESKHCTSSRIASANLSRGSLVHLKWINREYCSQFTR